MDAGVSLSEHFDMNLTSLLPITNRVQAFPAGSQAITEDEA